MGSGGARTFIAGLQSGLAARGGRAAKHRGSRQIPVPRGSVIEGYVPAAQLGMDRALVRRENRSQRGGGETRMPRTPQMATGSERATLSTYRDLLNTPDNGKRYEVIEGEMVVSPVPKTRHQLVVGNLFALLRRAQQKGFGVVLVAPTDVLFAEYDVTQPDLLFISKERLHILGEDNVRGAPDLVVEIISESTRRRDVLDKRELYERHGVPFYWIVDPEEESVRVFGLHNGKYGEPAWLRGDQKIACRMFPGIEQDIGSLFEHA